MRVPTADILGKAAREGRKKAAQSLNDVSSAIGEAIVILSNQTGSESNDEVLMLLEKLEEAQKSQKDR